VKIFHSLCRVARLGEFGGTLEENTPSVEHEVREYWKHPFYDIDANANDVAVLELATSVVYTGEFGFTSLYSHNMLNTVLFSD